MLTRNIVVNGASSRGVEALAEVTCGLPAKLPAALLAVKQSGGLAVVQDPQTAVIPDVPQSALDLVTIDHSLPAEEHVRHLRALLSGDAVSSTD